MSVSELFLDTLNKLQFPRVDKYNCSDFDSLLSDPELKSFIQSLSSLNEENVLSTEELEEYLAIPADELEYLENLAHSDDSFLEESSEEEEREELKFLQKHLSLIEAYNENLERQKEKLKFHHIHLLTEKDKCKKTFSDAKKLYDEYNVQNVSHAETEFVSAMLSTSNLIGELQSVISESDCSNKLTPSSSFKGIENYFEEEKQLVKCIEDFLHKDIELTEDPAQFTVKLPGLSQKDMQREVCFLRKVFKSARIDEIEALSQSKKLSKVVQFYTNFEEKHYPHVFEISSVQLQNKLEVENIKYQQLIEKENVLKLCLSKAINENVDAQCCKIGTACSKEVLQAYGSYLGKIQVPLEHLISQRSRLEIVLFYLDAYKRKLEDIKNLVQNTSTFIEKEKSEFHIRKCQYEKEMEKQIPKKSEHLSDKSIFLHAYEILSNAEQSDLSFVSMNDLMQKVEKLHEEKENIEKVQNKKFNILKLWEDDRIAMEKLIFKGKKFADLLEKDSSINKHMNQLHLKDSTLISAIAEFNSYKNKKQMILEKSLNQRLARKLFIFALTNKETFVKWLENIKDRCKFLTE
ncbi:HAUS augmin-like complex subunit 3 [Argiope bruennichi]|uniref:HAUS augmin-like complex subunit 3 n=1 Tax=Argiope bruennichi TaxID=94029 RepID=UPI00249590DB|nr:HAUS augmin-like complex subunit 3 [Argiope bruennichi]